jgi:peptidoglycan/xylan/chitin deacetylase (PgdA/CDA1 family)
MGNSMSFLLYRKERENMAIDFRESYPVINWDLSRQNLFFNYFGKESDSARGFKVQISQSCNVLFPTTESLRIYCVKQDNSKVYDNAIIDGSLFVIDLDNQVFAIPGIVKCELQISSGGEWLSSETFYINVDENLVDGSILSSDDYIAFRAALDQIDDLTVDVNTAVQNVNDLETTITNNEAARNLFENYDNAKAYFVGNKVSYLGSSYVCLVNSTSNLPTDTNYWLLFASKGDKGDQGIQGTQGEQGIQGIQGEIGVNWLDAYSSTTTYNERDAVSYNGSSYYCILQSINNLPTNTTYWSPLALKGIDGSGGDMFKSTYDTQNKATDIFTYVDDKVAGVTFANATTTSDGLMSKEDKILVNDIDNEVSDIYHLQNYEINNRSRKVTGLVSFVTDDANTADYITLMPIFSAESVSCCTAVPSNKVATNDVSTCTLSQLQELQNTYGWEILSHSANHAHLTALTDAEAEAELKDSYDWLNANGLKCQSFAVPYGEYGTREKKLAKKYYRCMRTSLFGLTNGTIPSINSSPIETHELRSIWIPEGTTVTTDVTSGFSNQSLDYYKYYIDKALANGAWLIISMHSWDIRNSSKESLLTSIIQYAKSKMPVVTFKGALNIIGNVIEAGDYARQNRTNTHFVVGADGTIDSNLLPEMFVGYDMFKPSNVLTDYKPNRITTTLISASYASANGFPVAKGGTFKTYRVTYGSEPLEYNRQQFITFDNEIYERRHGASAWMTTWTRTSTNPIPATNAYTDTTAIGSFPVGVSYTRIQTAYASNFPEALGGTLVTHNIEQTAGSLGFNWQEYHIYATAKVYKRPVNSDGTYGSWSKISAV